MFDENKFSDFQNNIRANTVSEFAQSKGPKKAIIIACIFFVLIFLAIIGLLFTYDQFSSPLSSDNKKLTVIVSDGEKNPTIGADLQSKGIIRSAFFFELYLRFSQDASKIRSGVYSLSPNMSIKQIVTVFSSSSESYSIVKIKEGWTINYIADYLQQNHFASKSDLLSAVNSATQTYSFLGETPKKLSLEGYLFPDTYYVDKNFKSEILIAKMLQNTDQKVDSGMRAQIFASHKTIYNVLTIASIVEKEVGRNTKTVSSQDLQTLNNERKIVAGIFYNRLAVGMPLQSDATVNYATGKNNLSASAADIQIDSPYNTYKYSGLPPGPISNPSLSSIMAAIYPAQTDYLYFLSKPDGTAVFAKTLQEQLANKQKYLK